MKGQYYRIDWDTCERLHLYGREAMVYCALIYLCKRAPYTGSATELAEFSHCGKSTTALRMLWSLEKKGLIIRGSDGIKVLQIAAKPLQNEVTTLQIETISKEKRTKKENNNKEIKNNSSSLTCEKKKKTASPNVDLIDRLFFMDTTNSPVNRLTNSPNQIPANTGYYKIIVLEYGYMNPKRFVDEFYHYWDGQGWPERGNKLSLMRSWMDMYQNKHPKSKPNLNETERLVMRTFVSNIEERLIVRLFNIVKCFEVAEKVIYFYVPEDNAKDFAAWLNTLPLAKILAAYHRTVSVRIWKYSG